MTTRSTRKHPIEEPEADLKLTKNSVEPAVKKLKIEEPEVVAVESDDVTEESDAPESESTPTKDDYAREMEQRRIERANLLEVFERGEKLGGEDFEAEQQRVINELNKQRDTIKALLDDMKATKAELAAAKTAPPPPPAPKTNSRKSAKK